MKILWSNLHENSESVISSFHERTSSEKLYSIRKADINVEQLPSGKVFVNEMILLNCNDCIQFTSAILENSATEFWIIALPSLETLKRLRKVIVD